MAEKYLLFNLEDDEAKKLGEVMSNTTARKIVNFLAEKEASETDISKELNLALNTVEYNLKKLLEAGVIEKSKNFLWSKKGKKISSYRVANKLIVISSKKTAVYDKLKGIVPVVLISAIFSFFIFWVNRAKEQVQEKVMATLPQAETAGAAGEVVSRGFILPIYAWFLIGIWILVVIYVIWNLKKR